MANDVIYRADVITENNENKFYIGSCSTTFKERFGDHKSSLNNFKYRTKTELSTYVWHLKENNINHEINWKILARAKSYKNGSSTCNLCLTEKYFIFKADSTKILNNKYEMTEGRHRVKFKFKNFKFP